MYMYVLQITKEEFDMEARKLFKSDKGKFKPIIWGSLQEFTARKSDIVAFN